METRKLSEARRYSPDKLLKINLYQTERLLYDVYCLEPGQAQRVHTHSSSDKVYLVIEGQAKVTVSDEERVLGPNEAALAPAGSAHGVSNPGPARLALLVVTTPPPHPGG